jgi:hypothetical protein
MYIQEGMYPDNSNKHGQIDKAHLEGQALMHMIYRLACFDLKSQINLNFALMFL